MRTLLGLIVLVFVFSCKKATEETSLNKTVPQEHKMDISSDYELDVYDFDGLEPLLSTTSEKTYVVNFWATWCVPCIKEMPYFEKLNAEYKDQNVEVLLVSLDFPKDYDKKLKNFINKHNLKSKVVALNDVDSNRWIPKVSEEWSGAIPATIIFNKDKSTFYERTFNYSELETEVKQFLN
jgi:thiol-disulfide isomerase/thioredoxin